MQGFQQYRDKFTELSAHVSNSQLTAVGRCRLALRVLPESLLVALTIGNKGEFTDIGELFESARLGIQAIQYQSDGPSTCLGCSYSRPQHSTGPQGQAHRLLGK